MTAISFTPVYTHFHDTLTGLVTIRAFRQTDKYIKQNEMHLNDFIRASYSSLAAFQWLNFRLQMISVSLITIAGFTAVFQHIYSEANSSLVGLALSNMLSVAAILNGLVVSFTETEKEMVSVERIYQFNNLEFESWQGVETVNEDWPKEPSVEFLNVNLKYENQSKNSLDSINLTINAGEKIGICGRTGAGKSSLFVALFREIEINSGLIRIDNVNIANLDLNKLRNSLNIIPQDPFLFNATLRENLDLTRTKSDHEIWQVLRKCNLEDKFRSNPAGLDLVIQKDGKNLSTGQKHLMCLARALLSNRKILCIDEATAYVDYQTDLFIQKTIMQEFKHATVLNAFNRVNTVFDYNKIIVMNDGKIVEFDTPKNLLRNKSSLFYHLVYESKNI